MQNIHDKPVYVCGEYRIDTRRRRLFVRDSAVTVNARAFDVLVELVQNAGRVVTKDELMSAVWPDTVVEENNLTQQISTLRKHFNERAGDHRFIATVPGRGYCFVGQISEQSTEPEHDLLIADSRMASLTIDISNSDGGRPISSLSFDPAALRGAAIATAYVLVICLSALIFGGEQNALNAGPRSVGILNFRTLGTDTDGYGDGFSYTLRAKLGSLDDVTVRVNANSTPDSDMITMGRKMGVDVVLAGSIQKENDRIRVAVEMIDVRNERIIWGRTFDDNVEHVFELQDSIAVEVMRSLRGNRRSSLPYRQLDEGTPWVLKSASVAAARVVPITNYPITSVV